MSTANVSLKRCVHCHKDVTVGKRMKDSSGKYWCINCGQTERKRKALAGMKKSRGSVDKPGTHAGKGRLIKALVVAGLLVAAAIWRFSSLN